MDSGLNHIESMYLSYSGLLEEFSEDVIRSRYAFLYKECMEFLKSQKLESEVRLDEVLLMHAVLDYFSDVSRLKKFHHIHHINETKVIAYETFWLLRRKPLQVVTQRQDDFLAFINEKFVFSRLAAFLVGNRKDQVLREQDKKGVYELSGYALLFSEIPPVRPENAGVDASGLSRRGDLGTAVKQPRQ